MENSFSVANFFIKKSLDEKNPVTPLKLLKLVYLSHGWYMGFYKKPLIPDDIEAWKYGPVVKNIYHEFKKFGNEPITELARDLNDIVTFKYKITESELEVELLNQIWEVYGQMSGVDLSSITHKEGSPWDRIWNKNGGNLHYGAIIPNGLIMQYYKEKIADARRNPTK